MSVGLAEQPVAFHVVSSKFERRRRPITVFEGMLNMCAELVLQFSPEQGLNFGLAHVTSGFDHLVYARPHNRKSGREKRRALARKARIGRLQRERYGLGDNILEMHAAAKDVPAIAAEDMGDAAHEF